MSLGSNKNLPDSPPVTLLPCKVMEVIIIIIFIIVVVVVVV